MTRYCLLAVAVVAAARSDPFDWHRLQEPDNRSRPASPDSLRLVGELRLHRSGGRQAVFALADGTLFRTSPGNDLVVAPGRLIRLEQGRAQLRIEAQPAPRTLWLRRRDAAPPP